jgi:hypothetical protein
MPLFSRPSCLGAFFIAKTRRMSEIKRNFTGVFIPANIWLSKELIPSEKMLLGEIDALSKDSGWCYASRKHFAEWLQCSLPNVSYYVEKLERLGFLEVSRKQGERSKMRLVNARFYEQKLVNGTDGVVNGTDGVVNGTDGVVNGTDGVVNGTDGVVNGTDPKYKYISKKKEKSKEKGKENDMPQAAVTTFTPDQIEQTAVTIVAQEIFTLEAEKENNPIPGGPLKEKDIPASQDAGTFEANPLPPNFSPSKPKAAKTPAGPESAIIDPAVLEFYQAIAADWEKWKAYKRREKKGTYKSPETEAVTITGLFNRVAGNPDDAKAAIQYSIEQTWTGIFPEDKKKKQPDPVRYSLDDHPANPATGQALLEEISAFYRNPANAGLWSQTLKAAKVSGWTPEKQTQVVSRFCLHQVSTDRAKDSFGQLNARLQKWFETENNMQAGQTGSPSTVHQAPARVASPVRYQDAE